MANSEIESSWGSSQDEETSKVGAGVWKSSGRVLRDWKRADVKGRQAQGKLRVRKSSLFEIPSLPRLLLLHFFCDIAILYVQFLLLPSSPRYPEFEFVLSTKLRKRRLRNRFSASHSFSARATFSLLDKSPPKKFHRLERALSLQQRWRNPTSSVHSSHSLGSTALASKLPQIARNTPLKADHATVTFPFILNCIESCFLKVSTSSQSVRQQRQKEGLEKLAGYRYKYV